VFLWFASRELKTESEDGGFSKTFAACVVALLLQLHRKRQ